MINGFVGERDRQMCGLRTNGAIKREWAPRPSFADDSGSSQPSTTQEYELFFLSDTASTILLSTAECLAYSQTP